MSGNISQTTEKLMLSHKLYIFCLFFVMCLLKSACVRCNMMM